MPQERESRARGGAQECAISPAGRRGARGKGAGVARERMVRAGARMMGTKVTKATKSRMGGGRTLRACATSRWRSVKSL